MYAPALSKTSLAATRQHCCCHSNTMISAHLQPVCGLQGVQRTSRNARLLLDSCQGLHRHVRGAIDVPAIDSRSSGSSSSRHSVRCQAEPEPVGGYTPADYISFSQDDNKQCHHNAEVLVDAPLDVCYSMWSDWTKLLDFLDLVGQVGLDNGSPNMALFQCFYRFRKLPLMEIVFLLEREERQDEQSKSIHFKSVYGMPIKGQVLLTKQSSGETKVQLYFTHPVPTLLVQLQIGPFGLETDFRQILKENMASYKQQAEAAAPVDWQQPKQQVAARVKATSDRLQAQSASAQKQVGQPTPVQAASQQQPEQQQPQQQVGGQPSPPAEPQQQQGAGKQRRSTTAKAGAAAAAAEAAGDVSGAAQQQSTPRGRKSTRTRTVSAAAGADESSSTSSGAAKRRSRMSSSAAVEAEPSNGNGAGSADSGSGRKSTARRSTTRKTTTKRSSTAAQE